MNLKYKPWCIALFLLLCSAGHLRAQDVTVRSGFFKDSLRVGDVTGYYLTARYLSKLNILFPDSAFNFAPFEYDHKKYFPTETEGGKSYDSVVYYLSTFEIDRIQDGAAGVPVAAEDVRVTVSAAARGVKDQLAATSTGAGRFEAQRAFTLKEVGDRDVLYDVSLTFRDPETGVLVSEGAITFPLSAGPTH